MGKIVVSDNLSLEGIIQDPAGHEGFSLGGRIGLIAPRRSTTRVAFVT